MASLNSNEIKNAGWFFDDGVRIPFVSGWRYAGDSTIHVWVEIQDEAIAWRI